MQNLFPTLSASWTPTGSNYLFNIALTATTHSINIPTSIVPDSAKEMLIYAYVYGRGTATYNTVTNLDFYVVQDGVTHLKRMFLYEVVNQYTVNSDNMWFPVPSNRLLYFNVPHVFSQSTAYGYALGYR